MVGPNRKKGWISCRTPLYAAMAAVAVMLLLFVNRSDPAVLYIFLVAPATCLVFLVLLIIVVIKRPRRIPLLLLTTLVFVVTSAAMLTVQHAARPSLRWFLWSRRIKAQVLAQPIPANEEFRHVEWDGWGGAPVGDWTAYVVYDPADSLLAAARDRDSKTYHRYEGIPCKVDSVRRLENHWYFVTLGMNEWWDRCSE